MDKKTGTVVKKYITKANEGITKIIEDNKDPNILWLGSWGKGLVKFDKETEVFKYYEHDPNNPETISNPTIHELLQDNYEGVIWTGCFLGGGLNRFDKKTGTFTHNIHDPENPSSIGSNAVTNLYQDSEGTLWIGTDGGGLNKRDKKTGAFVRYSKKDGYPGEVFSILGDDSGNLWLGTAVGLVKFNPETKTVARIYDQSDGLQSNVFNNGSAYKTRDGEMWFGGTGGVNSFYPDKVKDNPYIPPIVLTSFKQEGVETNFGKNIERLKEIKLGWRNNFFEFEFAALNYTQPDKNQYRYMLEGFDHDWFDSGTKRFGRYSNLPGGIYTLKIIGSNNDGIWNDKGCSLKIFVTPPPWKTWWAFTLYVFVAIGGVLGFVKWRVKKTEAQKRQLTILVAERTNQLKTAMEQAKSANRTKSEFLTNMSHEIRTPMNAILGFSELLFSKEKDEQKKECLSNILASGRSLLTLINDILDLSKVEAGKLNLEYAAVSPQQSFDEMRMVFGQEIQDKGLELIIDIPPNLPKALLLDKVRLRQILINLVGNAIKFTESGYIKLSVQYRYPDDMHHSTLDLIFSVEDTGMGIPEDQRESIFTTFNQVKGQKVSQFGGTGLGLSITKRLIEIMNGKISVSSELGKGSTFHILLKEVEVASLESPKPSQEKQIDFATIRFEKSTILIADDIEFNRDLMRGYFEAHDLTLLEAKNGLETIETARQHHPQLILLDMKMPEMDGYEAAVIMKKDDTLKNIPIIAVTASALKNDEEIINTLCDTYLRKPVSKTELIHEVMKFLPHTVIKGETVTETANGAPVEIKEELAPETLKKLPELFEIIRKEQARCRILSETMPIHEIEDFAGKMKKIGAEYHCQPLVVWSESLYSAARAFDIEVIRQALSKLQILIENVKNRP